MHKFILIFCFILSANLALADDSKKPCSVSSDIKRLRTIDCATLKEEIKTFFIEKRNHILYEPAWKNLNNYERTGFLNTISNYTKAAEDCLAKQMINQEELTWLDIHMEIHSVKDSIKFAINNNIEVLNESLIESYDSVIKMVE